MRYFYIAVLLLTSGCVSPGYELSGEDQLHVQAEAVTNVAWVVAFQGDTPSPLPSPSPSGLCDNCGGTGRLGDGTVSVKCPVCDGTGKRIKGEHGCVEGATFGPLRPAGVLDLKELAPVGRSVRMCDCPMCGCPDCECVDGKCKCPQCVPDYATGYNLAKKLGCGLLVCVGPCDPVKCHRMALERGLVVCGPWSGCPHESGCWAYIRQEDGRLLLEQAQAVGNTSIKPMNGGYMSCGPSGCQWVPDEFSQGTNFSPMANGYSFSGGSCASGNCGSGSTIRRRGR